VLAGPVWKEWEANAKLAMQAKDADGMNKAFEAMRNTKNQAKTSFVYDNLYEAVANLV